MTITNAPDTINFQENLPDGFCRRTSSSCSNDKPSMAAMLSGVVHAREQDVVCRLMLKRRLVMPYRWQEATPEILQ